MEADRRRNPRCPKWRDPGKNAPVASGGMRNSRNR